MVTTIEKELKSISISRIKISISDARKDLSKLVHDLESNPNKIIELDRRDNPLALLLSYSEYSPIINAFKDKNLKVLLANFVANKWLGSDNIPDHLYKPQLVELNTMEPLQLLILSQVEPTTSIDSIKENDVLDQTLVERLIKRYKIAKAIADAKKNNLYDVAEHLLMNNNE